MDVSVIIPAYNAAQTIAASVASVIAAKGEFQIEILVVDDASSDATWACLQSLSAQYPELKPLKNNRRKGPSGARNTGLDAASGQYIAFLDADDVWYENHLRLGLGFLQRHAERDAIIFDQDIFDAKTGQKISTWITEKQIIHTMKQSPLSATEFALDDNIAVSLLNESFLHLQTLIVKRSAIQAIRFEENVFRAEDLDFGVQMYLRNCAFAYSTVTTGIYYRNSDSLTAKNYENDIKTARDMMFILRKYLHSPETYAVPAGLLKAMMRERLLRIAYPQRKTGKKYEALKSVCRSFNYGFSLRQCKELIKVVVSFAA